MSYSPVDWFAWYPVKAVAYNSMKGFSSGGWVWLQTVSRYRSGGRWYHHKTNVDSIAYDHASRYVKIGEDE